MLNYADNLQKRWVKYENRIRRSVYFQKFRVIVATFLVNFSLVKPLTITIGKYVCLGGRSIFTKFFILNILQLFERLFDFKYRH